MGFISLDSQEAEIAPLVRKYFWKNRRGAESPRWRATRFYESTRTTGGGDYTRIGQARRSEISAPARSCPRNACTWLIWIILLVTEVIALWTSYGRSRAEPWRCDPGAGMLARALARRSQSWMTGAIRSFAIEEQRRDGMNHKPQQPTNLALSSGSVLFQRNICCDFPCTTFARLTLCKLLPAQ